MEQATSNVTITRHDDVTDHACLELALQQAQRIDNDLFHVVPVEESQAMVA